MSSTARPCDQCAHYLRCSYELLACSAFVTWVDTGLTPAACRNPNRETYAVLARFDSPMERYQAERQRQAAERRAARLAELIRQARRETFEHKRMVAAGLAQPRTRAERRKIQLARRRRRWRIDPTLRERHLRLKREDAIRRGRRRGDAPAGSNGARLHRMEGQGRRRQAERERAGRTLNGAQFRELRERLGISVREIAERFGATHSAAKQWQKYYGPPGHVEAWIRTLASDAGGVPAPPRSVATPAVAVIIGAPTHG